MERCGANTKRGAVCNKPAGWGTPYRHGRCKLHGGATPTHVKAAQRREAERTVEGVRRPSQHRGRRTR
jgi:hypothetical protein